MAEDTQATITVTASDLASEVLQSLGQTLSQTGDAATQSSQDVATAASGISDALDAAGTSASDLAEGMQSGLSQASDSVDGFVSSTTESLSQLPGAAEEASSSTSGVFSDLWGSISSTASDAWSGISDAVSEGVSGMGESLEGVGEQITSAFESPLSAAGSAVSGFLEELGPMGVAAAAVGAAAVAAGAGVFELASSAAETTEGIQQFSVMTGMSVGQTEQLKAMADIAGSSLENMTMVSMSLARQMSSTGATQDKFQAGLQALSIDVDAFKAAALPDQLVMVSNALKTGADGMSNMQALTDVFGSRARAVFPLVSKDLGDISDAASGVALKLGSDDVEASEQFNIQLGALKESASNLGTEIGLKLLPVAQGFLDLLSDGGVKASTTAYGNIELGASYQNVELAGTQAAAAISSVNSAAVQYGPTLAQLGTSAAQLAASAKAANDYAVAWQAIAEAEANYGQVDAPLTASQKGQIANYQALGESVQTIATALGVTTGQVTAFEAAEAKATQTATQHAAAVDALVNSLQGDSKQEQVEIDALTGLATQTGLSQQTIDNMTAAITKLEDAGVQLPDALYQWDEANRQVLSSTTVATSASDTYRVAVQLLSQVGFDPGADSATRFADAMQQAGQMAQGYGAQVPDLTSEQRDMTQAFQDAADAADNLNTSSLKVTTTWASDLGPMMEQTDMGFVGLVTGAQSAQHQIDQLTTSTSKLGTTIDNEMTRALDSVPSTLINAFESGDISKGLTQVATQLGNTFAKTLMQQVQAGITGGSIDWSQMATSAIGVGAGIVASATANPSSTGGDVLHGAAEGAEIGAVAGPIGAGVGAGVGAIVGAFSTPGPTPQQVSGEQTEGSFEQSLGGLAPMLATIDQALQDLGASASTASTQAQAMGTSLIDAETGGASAVQAQIANIDSVLTAAQQLGVNATAALSAISAAIPSATSNFNAMSTALQGNTAGMQVMGSMAQTTFAAQLAGGVSVSTALTNMKGGLDALTASYAVAANVGQSGATMTAQSYQTLWGSIGSVATESMLFANTLNEQNPTLMAGVSALGSQFQNLATLGQLNSTSFGQMEQAGSLMYTQLQGQVASLGGTTADALLPMQDYLQQAAAQATQLGIPLDANTQELITQSQQLGIWSSTGTDATASLNQSMQTLVTSVQSLVTELQNVVTTTGSIPKNVSTTVTTNYVSTGNPAAPVATAPGAATGGFVTDTGIEHFASGGYTGVDSVRAMLAPGEFVLTPPQVGRLMGASSGFSLDDFRTALAEHAQQLSDRLSDQFDRMMQTHVIALKHALRGA